MNRRNSERQKRACRCQISQLSASPSTYHSLNSLVSLMPILFGSYPLCRALRIITGKADEYFRAFARCWPPQPEDTVGFFRTLLYSIKHCRSRIRLGMLMMRGTMYAPPQPLSGLPVEDTPDEKNIQIETNRSPRTLAYDVSTSANRISPNFPSCASAIPPTLTLLRVWTKRDRPTAENRLIGRMRSKASRKR